MMPALLIVSSDSVEVTEILDRIILLQVFKR